LDKIKIIWVYSKTTLMKFEQIGATSFKFGWS